MIKSVLVNASTDQEKAYNEAQGYMKKIVARLNKTIQHNDLHADSDFSNVVYLLDSDNNIVLTVLKDQIENQHDIELQSDSWYYISIIQPIMEAIDEIVAGDY